MSTTPHEHSDQSGVNILLTQDIVSGVSTMEIDTGKVKERVLIDPHASESSVAATSVLGIPMFLDEYSNTSVSSDNPIQVTLSSPSSHMNTTTPRMIDVKTIINLSN